LTVAIGYLADHAELLHVLAAWFYDEWGQGDPPFNLKDFEAQFRARLHRDKLPLALVALNDGVPVATASLKMQEMETHPQYLHWLGGVYTLPEFRGQGIGSQVVEAAAVEAKRLGVEELYLYTRRNVDLYAKLGWMTIEQPLYLGKPVVIMRRRL